MLERRKFLRMSALGLAGLPLIRIGRRLRAKLSDQAGALGGRLSAGRRDRHPGAADGPAHLSEKLGQQFIIENKPGAGNNIATEFVINSPPDGYTVYLVNPANGINASLYKKLTFNFVRDMAPVGGIMRVPNVMTVHSERAGEDRGRVHRARESQSRTRSTWRRPATAPRCICRASCS